MQRHALWAAMLSAGLLAACGGSGGGSKNSAPNEGAANVSMSGTAAKGRMANAVVTAHAVKADGTIDAGALASTVTDAQGNYTLRFSAQASQPYVIKVSAKADGSTTHLDEVSGTTQTLPVGFELRALFVPATGGNVTTSASVTPFSELAVSAAERSSGGLTEANVAQAVSTVTQLLGFDPTGVAVTSTTDAAADVNQQKLALLLTAVSQLANNGALGCDAGTAGAKVACVVDKMAESASSSSLKLDAGVSSALSTAVNTVLSDPALRGNVNGAALTSIVANLDCVGDACKPAPVGTTPEDKPVPTAIAAAKLMFTDVRSDWISVFGTGAKPGAVRGEASKFEQAMKGVQAPVEMLMKDSSALLLGVDLYNDYKAGRTTLTTVTGGANLLAGDTWAFEQFNSVACTLYQDEAATTQATAIANANFVGCSATYYVAANTPNPGAFTTWRHGFTIKPTATAGSYEYATRARQRTGTANVSLQPNFYTGTVSVQTDEQGSINGFQIAGQLAGAFKSGDIELVNEYHDWTLNGTRQGATSTVTGSVVAKDAANTTLATLEVKSASLTEIQVSRDSFGNIVHPEHPNAVDTAGGELSEGSVHLRWTIPGADFEGSFALSGSQWDKSLTMHTPTKAVLSGSLRTVEGGTISEFLTGKLTASVIGFDTYRRDLPSSPDNYYKADLSFVGKATAPGRPLLELTIGTSLKSYEDEVSSVSLQYRSLVNGTPRLVVSASASRDSNGVETFTLSEATSNLSMKVQGEATTATLLLGGTTTVGTLDVDKGLMTFADGSFVSVDMGL
ncbi:hypothetical protein [Caldimonas brevitalea]|uniref:Carboxypeptidase regulatory-like domain-containing protein n=1 Tax=Caldimonas brevitalea TaxID=413882 RepID=A0A0G3BT48_9BURK|nr:hypothetical protein [Caldimonas brevitalea]AKJ30546.1 hypothetical protein AAW51_3855 [Caldimonas brevitalea]